MAKPKRKRRSEKRKSSPPNDKTRNAGRNKHPATISVIAGLAAAHAALCAMMADHLENDARLAAQTQRNGRQQVADMPPPGLKRQRATRVALARPAPSKSGKPNSRAANASRPYVFISYKSERREVAATLVAKLRDIGIRVWWDQDIAATGPFRDEIERRLDGAQAVIVLWCGASIGSDFVRSEANHAHAAGKLINTHCPDVAHPSRQLPKPFGETRSVAVDDVPAIVTALKSLGVTDEKRKRKRPAGAAGRKSATHQKRQPIAAQPSPVSSA